MEFYLRIKKSSINQGLLKGATSSKEIIKALDRPKKLMIINMLFLTSMPIRWSTFLTLVSLPFDDLGDA